MISLVPALVNRITEEILNNAKFNAGKKIHEFGACNNCHFYGEVKPIQGAQTWAPNLVLTKERLRPEWVVEWMRNPHKIMPGTKMPAPYLPTSDLLQVEGAVNIWGPELIEINGDVDIMLEGLRDYIYNIQGKSDITNIVKDYFKTNGYDFDSEDGGEDEDEWDDEW
mgnify:CR=1 FL=1